MSSLVLHAQALTWLRSLQSEIKAKGTIKVNTESKLAWQFIA